MKTRFSHWIVPVLFACATMLAWPPAAESTPKIVAAPMQNKVGRIDYPRLTRFPDAGVRKRVNAALAQREAADRSQRSDCFATLREQGQKPDKDSFAERIDVRYLSARYLSIEVHLSYFCGTAYPTNDDAAPLTFDLETGTEVDWGKLFKAGFLPSPGDANAGTSQLGKLYQARYAITKIAADIAEPCQDAISSDAPFSQGVILWLDRGEGGLVAMPSFPHVIEACAVPLGFSPSEIAPYTTDKAFLADIKTTGGP